MCRLNANTTPIFFLYKSDSFRNEPFFVCFRWTNQWGAGLGGLQKILPFFGGVGYHTACRILVLRPGMEPVPPPVEARSLNLWTARKSHYTILYQELEHPRMLVSVEVLEPFPRGYRGRPVLGNILPVLSEKTDPQKVWLPQALACSLS